MRETRVIVTGMYVNKSTYVLYMENGDIFKTIREGEPFRIGNQMRAFMPVRVPKKNGHGTILMCQKRSDDGFVLEQFPLLHRKKGLWALTSGAARNGVFHTYHAPQGELEAFIASKNYSLRIIERVPSIEGMVFEVGGPCSGEYLNPWGLFIKTDGKEVDDFDPKVKPGYQYHKWVTNATYVIHFKEEGRPYFTRLERVVITPQAEEKEVIKVLEGLKAL